MTKKVHHTESEVEQRLGELDLTRPMLVQLVMQTMRIVMGCTELESACNCRVSVLGQDDEVPEGRTTPQRVGFQQCTELRNHNPPVK